MDSKMILKNLIKNLKKREESNREASRSFIWREWREDIPTEQVRTLCSMNTGVIDQEHILAMSLVVWQGLWQTQIH